MMIAIKRSLFWALLKRQTKGTGNMKQTLISTILMTLLLAGTAAAERRYFLEGLEITIPDTWIDIDSQTDFLKNKKLIETYTQPSAEGSLPLVRIIEVAAPGNDRGMLTFSIKPCYRGECPTKKELQAQSKTVKVASKNQKLITDDGSELLEDYGISVEQGCAGYFVTRGQKVKAPFGGVFISKSKTYYRNNYVINASAGYAEEASDEVVERTEAALNSFKCTTDLR
jgi:hypothetical protein